jgi:hypothetical protein
MRASRIAMLSRADRMALAVGLVVAIPCGSDPVRLGPRRVPARNGEIALETFSLQDNAGGPPIMASDTIESTQQTIARCDNGSGPTALPRDFGRPSFTPSGNRVGVSVRSPTSPFFGQGATGG